MPTYLERLRGSRQETTKAATKNTWEGTTEMVAAIVHESRRYPAWKPHRAALMAASHMINDSGPFMTAAEFAQWRIEAKVISRKRDKVHPRDVLEMGVQRYGRLGNARLSEAVGIRISRVESLACAHYLMGWPLPVTDLADLPAWFRKTFGDMEVASVLNISTAELSACLLGYKIVEGVKVIYVPGGPFLRALDWVARMGPVSPYGTRPAHPDYSPEAGA